ncbi:MAG TPA: glycosyltransferase family 4 protein [Burkholderiaceae bacterium]|nr:glycosyltransferase family 4 protein [Burkholderiaceae bacterium]
MRIGFFHPALAKPGGAELLCVAQAQHLRTAGDAVCFVTFEYDAAVWGHRMDGLEVRVAQHRRWTDGLAWNPRVAKLRRRGARAVRLLDGVDVVLAFNFPCSAMLGDSGLPLRKIWQCNEPPRGLHLREASPVLSAHADNAGEDAVDASTIHWRGALARADRKGRLAALRAFDIDQVARLDHIYAISEFSRDNARRIYGRCGQEVVYPIVRFPEGGWSRAGLQRQQFGVLVHSRLELVKNIDTVIRGFARFQATHSGSHLHVVGEGPARASLQELATQLMPKAPFTFHGYLPDADLRRVYEACDVFALLPLDEPFGMVFPEAAAKGLLLIGPDHGGPLEILDGGRLGWCVDAFSHEALAQALSEVARLSDTEADRRRVETNHACRARFAEAVVGPQLRRALTSATD